MLSIVHLTLKIYKLTAVSTSGPSILILRIFYFIIKKFWRLCQITWRKPFYSLRFKLTSFCKIDLTELKDSIVQKVNDFWCLEAIKEWENWENKRTLNRFHFENQAKLQYMNSHTICALLASNFNIIHLIFSTGKQFLTTNLIRK